MAKVIIGIGLPGSGKSNVLGAFAESYGYEYIPLDQIRKELGIGEGQNSTNEVLREVVARTLARYKEGKTVVVDGTFLNDMRKKFIHTIREGGAQKIQGMFIDTPKDIAWDRAQIREKDWEDKTPRSLFEERVRHKEAFPPSVTDDFDALFTLDENGTMKKVDLKEGLTREFTNKSFLR